MSARRVTIGANTVFTWDPVIHCSTTIDIGEGCMIGRVVIADGNHRFRDPGVPVMAQGYDFHPLTIGNGVMIANHAVVLASVGERTFVGANAVVTRDLPDYSVAVGAPARVVEYFGTDPARRTELSHPTRVDSGLTTVRSDAVGEARHER